MAKQRVQYTPHEKGAGARVTPRPARDGELRVAFGGRAALFDEIAKPRHKPAVDHPWRRP